MKILILGGYGVFGGRLAELLSNITKLELLISGRNQPRATAFCQTLLGEAKVTPVQLDRKDIGQKLAELAPDLVIDASGPFQQYGAARYEVIEACIRHGVNYLDFADAADFVFGVSQFDQAAREVGIFVLSGVSSFPVMTSAVLREMCKDMTIETVKGGIAPSPYAGIGLNVMRAVLDYAGTPVKLTRQGQHTTAPGLAESQRYTIAVPGKMPLKNTHFSLVDVPELQVLPPEFPELTDIWIGAGPRPEALHRMLNMLAKLRHRLNLPSFAPLAPFFHRVLNVLKFGEHRGGMFVHATGHRNGQPVERSWHLLAEGDDGPYIPSMAIEAIIRKILDGNPPELGARAAIRELNLSDYEHLFDGRSLYMGFRSKAKGEVPLYRQVLGDAFDLLPPQVQALHDDVRARSWSGTARVQRGTGLISRALGALFGFPNTADQVPVNVCFTPQDGGETWTRRFGTRSFSSVQTLGRKRRNHLVLERFGPVTVALALVVDAQKLFLIPRSWSFLGLPLPQFLLPKGQSFETQVDGAFCFDVEISAPLIGLIAAYQGELHSTAPSTVAAN
ncbi:saccharopine dehydrogenase [Sedimentitalea sp. CY04]|uniref:Saccharopine dehydrogenase n=1 Tax=Parasedimentitalea denitrificans TaxID=2211118 RepID=A0ABX0W4V1_9RHOB|nr:SDR family oxidoreductase [Sedimentitalea sp. CY04]NIZ59667.1 saccharopine dehydrogenase [Sedimentitalea sp. CY04]